MKHCEQCNAPLQAVGINASRQRFCSRSCFSKWRRNEPVHEGVCALCDKSFTLTRSCLEARTRRRQCLTTCPRCSVGGAANGRWKGGHRHWSPGRFGRDKDGLSWKTQRRLAWERAGNKCENPKCTSGPLRRLPDVHHKIPYRISQSHALDNLICYCQKCHLEEEARCQEVWGGQLVLHTATSRTPRLRAKSPKCSVCGEYRSGLGPGRSLNQGAVGTCGCTRKNARSLKTTGRSIKEIAAEVGVSERTIYYWFTPR